MTCFRWLLSILKINSSRFFHKRVKNAQNFSDNVILTLLSLQIKCNLLNIISRLVQYQNTRFINNKIRYMEIEVTILTNCKIKISFYLSLWYSSTTESESNSLKSGKESPSKLKLPKTLVRVAWRFILLLTNQDG